MASRISDDEIKAYYEKTMLPEYAKRNVTPPESGYDLEAN